MKVAPPGLDPVRNRDVLRQARVLTALAEVADVAVPAVWGTEAGTPPGIPPLFVMSYVEGESYEPRHQADGPRRGCDTRSAKAGAILRPLQQQVREQGLWACHLGPELGGQGYGQVKLASLNEILGRSHWAPTVFGTAAPDIGNAEILAMFGTPGQKARYLQPLLDGEIVLTFSMTAPQAGADPKEFVCRARRDGDEWVIDGEKWFSSNARYTKFLIVMEVTDPRPLRTGGCRCSSSPRTLPACGSSATSPPWPSATTSTRASTGTSTTTACGFRSTPCSGARASRSPRPGPAGVACTTPCGPSAGAAVPST